MEVFIGLCCFICVVMTFISCVTKISVAENYDKMFARVVYDEFSDKKISRITYEKILKEMDIVRYRIDADYIDGSITEGR